ncbi:hypothetical protein MAC_07527 [Metarhizium acridum CQMa 102]|uniref:Uncharacterized protein n=1 Tax=Metarhizium acridum (strain CQMa 102) TaxID=655827 RepID=E9ECC9_METAQ|nr:uncharacterized protein MAC_07527 [Metarhizium acridum CQMa 102]EFY86449.1 hypothetical protein MAC_07527 [Metarhizium acridum CQMa 102]
MKGRKMALLCLPQAVTHYQIGHLQSRKEVDVTELKRNHADADVAAIEEHAPEENKRILHRIYSTLLPIVAISYMFQFLGTSVIGLTAILGLRDTSEAKISGANSTYYFGFIVAAYPLMIAIAVCSALWGAVLMLTATTTNAADLLALGFFLGVCESPIGSTIAGITGDLASHGTGHMDSIAHWKDSLRVKGTMAGIKSSQFKRKQCHEVALDVKTWFIVIIQLCGNIPSRGVHSVRTLPNIHLRIKLMTDKKCILGSSSSTVGFDTFPTIRLQTASYVYQVAGVTDVIGPDPQLMLPSTRSYLQSHLRLSTAQGNSPCHYRSDLSPDPDNSHETNASKCSHFRLQPNQCSDDAARASTKFACDDNEADRVRRTK